ncbi:MAG: D-2-hydroxyacid dehydrogenase [Bacteroidetes bacterium]|nr:D-2-hydroxyacid dehydrogenase [Bacteroidota bacterium]
MNIVFLDAKTMGEVPNLIRLEKLGNYKAYQVTSPDERKQRILGADIIITCKVLIDKEIIDYCPSLKLICVAATGMNNVDVDYAHSKGIEVKNVTGYSSESVAQLTAGVILSLVNKINYFDTFVKSGAYVNNDMFTHYGPPIYELKGKTLGIIGLGSIGSRVAEIMGVFGMSIVYHSVSGNNNSALYQHAPLIQLLSDSDIISVHCPLNSATRNLLNKNNICIIKDTAILINMARGGIVNELDIVEALNNNKLGGYATDVFIKEPVEIDSPYFQLKTPEKVILTPHIAWTSVEARTLLIDKLCENILSFSQTQKF